ncbi:MAG TPA: Asp-tRNA(Asn)/Glu-tRNA(Gln) amidotransferase subunit GatB [Candidatus Acidoferrales bacterium]|jgi:aspartyl-tRNA(Asn)/glutamyl-tRNA(Gln) amidotransferase subunit B|nr:Asp-tRNA(Asn)/Glu-tRNA(Gln) amidotransferase subunit GatB [Candidatus Acidoferrales bacterium]
MDYEAVIGLETHVQLKTKSKMWCGCANEFGAPPNTHVCPVCLGLPGVLPVANDEGLRLTVLTGLLLNCSVPSFAKFDRKNYFYPDMPKNYQITQYDKPSTVGGYVDFEFNGGISRVRITRAHLEEDVGKNFHFDRNSGVDFNRAGVPLLEIVSEPDITGPDMAYEYLNALKDILVYGGVSDADMEKGMVRCDVNVSVRPKGEKALGAKIEIKNMNSFSGVRRALEYEIPRQIETLKSGGKLSQETRRWDDIGCVTEVMRTKEQAHDYRYFPEPDLMPFEPTEAWLAEVRTRVVELPYARKQRFMRDYQLPATDAQTFVWDVPLGHYFEREVKEIPSTVQGEQRAKQIKMIANWTINNLRSKLAEKGAKITIIESGNVEQLFSTKGSGSSYPTSFPIEGSKISFGQIYQLTGLIQSNTANTASAMLVFNEMYESGQSPAEILAQRGLAQVSDTGAIEKFCDEVIAANPKPVEDYKSGKVAALNSLKGQVMKLSKGKANPALVGEILEKKLKG